MNESNLVPLDNENGTFRESWECIRCGRNFIPITAKE